MSVEDGIFDIKATAGDMNLGGDQLDERVQAEAREGRAQLTPSSVLSSLVGHQQAGRGATEVGIQVRASQGKEKESRGGER
eukprot:760142-Hanusia_phi.AAC.1